jgi:hypothetical protein
MWFTSVIQALRSKRQEYGRPYFKKKIIIKAGA